MEKNNCRLKEIPYVFGGKTYMLRCNMNVLADVQEMNDGKLESALNEIGSIRRILQFLAAMLNDYADSMGWPERFTSRGIGRSLQNIDDVPVEDVTSLVYDAFDIDEDNGNGESGN